MAGLFGMSTRGHVDEVYPWARRSIVESSWSPLRL